jgi:hypothetical protein
MMNHTGVCRGPLKIEQWIGLRERIRVEEMRLTARKHDQIASLHAALSSARKCNGSRAPTEIVKDGFWKLRNRQTPRPTKLVVEEEGSTESKAVECRSENVHRGII